MLHCLRKKEDAVLFRWFKKRRPIPGLIPPITVQFVPDLASTLPQAANDNCFWKRLLAPGWPFEAATSIRRLRLNILHDPEYLLEGKVRLIDNCDTFLALFEALYIDQDESKAHKLAPKLNLHIPELMQHCPIKELRPK